MKNMALQMDKKNLKRRKALSESSHEPTDNESNGSESDDNSEMDELNVELVKKTEKVYWQVRKEYEETVENEGKEAFQRSMNTRSRPKLRNDKKPKPFVIHPINVKEKETKYGSVRDENGVIQQKCPLYPLTHVKGLPPMQYWTLTEVNVLADDELTLSHIPFLGDGVDDSEFYDELMAAFPDGIHGTKQGIDQYINDWILYYTVKRVIAENGISRNDQKAVRSVFRCINECFPNKGSVDSLEATYPDVAARFEPETVKRTEMTNEKGELTANFSPLRLLNSHELLICHRCGSYDCSMHDATPDNGFGKKKRHIPTPRDDDGEPCGSDCWHYAQSPTRAKNGKVYPFAMKNGKPVLGTKAKNGLNGELNIDTSNGTDINPSLNVAGWTPHEEALFGLLRESAGDNFCSIALMMAAVGTTKTCRQIYEYAKRTAPLSPRQDLPPTNQLSPVRSKSKKKNNQHRNFRAIKWSSSRGTVDNQSVYRPCQHDGPCSKQSGCRCAGVENLCTKYCGCGPDCSNRFPGCRCAPGNCRTKQCQCYFASWECDPDVCKSCNCDKFDDHNEPLCRNISIQRGLQKKLIVAPSQVAGWGCYAAEDIDKNDFVSEYCGEVISVEESERRGKIYDKIACSYLFGLNNDQVVDATRKGNVIRFANHSSHPNCRGKVFVVNGDHKIGIFANRFIKKGEEIFFDYAYNKNQQMQFVPHELPRSTAKTTLTKSTDNHPSNGKPQRKRHREHSQSVS